MLKRALSVVVCLFLSTSAYAQTLGNITGEVKDASGATIPGATVTAQNVATNATRTQQSNEVGAFAFPAMPPGSYVVKAELQGFRIAQNAVDLHVEETLRVGGRLSAPPGNAGGRLRPSSASTSRSRSGWLVISPSTPRRTRWRIVGASSTT